MRTQKLFLFILILFSSFGFGSAKFLTRNDPGFYYNYLNTNMTEYPLYAPDNFKGIKNTFYFFVPTGKEFIISKNYSVLPAFYESRGILDGIFRNRITGNVPSVFTAGFHFAYDKNFYAEFNGDIHMGDTSYFVYGDKRIYEISEPTWLSVDFPRHTYASLITNNVDFSIGKYQLSYGPFKYNLTLSDSALYYNNMRFRFKNDAFDYIFVFISMPPFLSSNEYFQQLKFGSFDAQRTAAYNRIEFNPVKNLSLSLATLNNMGGRAFNPVRMFCFSDNGLAGIDGLYKNEFIDFYGSYTLNYTNFRNSFALGSGKTFDIMNIKLRPSIEYYYTETNIYSSEIPYNNLYYRIHSLTSNPGSRSLFDTPYGFIYGENSRIFSLNLIVASKDGYISAFYNAGTNAYGNVEDIDMTILYKIFLGDIKLKYSKLNNGDKGYESFSVYYMVDLEMGI